MKRLPRFTGLTAIAALVALLASATNCGQEVTSPSATGLSVRYARGLSFAPVFPAGYSAAQVPFTTVRVVLNHSDGTVALDTLIAFPPSADSVAVSLSVRLLASAPPTGEPMSLSLNYIDAAGVTVFKGGPVTINAVPTALGQAAPPPVTIPVVYTGPGASATKVVISPKSQSVTAGAPFQFTAQAFDAANNVLPNTPVIFSSSNATLAVLPNAGSGSGTTSSGRGTVQITASLLTGGLTDVGTLIIQPVPNAIASCPLHQSGPSRTPPQLHSALAE